MKLGILCVAVAYFATLANGKILSDPVKSYENHQVFRIEIASKENHETLSSIHGIHFWNEGRIGGHADVMVAPEEIEQFKQFLSEQGFKYSTMIENVGDLIKLEKVSKTIDILDHGPLPTECKDPSFAQSLVIFASYLWQLPEWPF